MIQPFKSGDALLAEIAGSRPEPGCLAVWWLGQSGFLIQSRNGILVIDPYLSEHLTLKYAGTAREHVRMTAAPFRGKELRGVDLVLGSHKHSDHIDPGTLPDLMEASPRATLAVPRALVDHAIHLGLPGDRVVGLEAGDVFEKAGFRVRAIPSAHEGLDTDADGFHLYLGFVVEAEGRRVYHSGDSMRYEAMADWLGHDPFDAMFLPINGRNPSRGVPGNMSAAEAVDLASLVRPRYVVPHHFDMFTFNTVPVSEFAFEARRLPEGTAPVVLECGQLWEIRP